MGSTCKEKACLIKPDIKITPISFKKTLQIKIETEIKYLHIFIKKFLNLRTTKQTHIKRLQTFQSKIFD